MSFRNIIFNPVVLVSTCFCRYTHISALPLVWQLATIGVKTWICLKSRDRTWRKPLRFLCCCCWRQASETPMVDTEERGMGSQVEKLWVRRGEDLKRRPLACSSVRNTICLLYFALKSCLCLGDWIDILKWTISFNFCFKCFSTDVVDGAINDSIVDDDCSGDG